MYINSLARACCSRYVTRAERERFVGGGGDPSCVVVVYRIDAVSCVWVYFFRGRHGELMLLIKRFTVGKFRKKPMKWNIMGCAWEWTRDDGCKV